LRALAALILIPVLVGIFFEGRKVIWDNRVRELCEKEGGVWVYENAQLPQQYFDRDGLVRIPSKSKNPDHPLAFEAKPSDPYYYEWIDEPVVEGYLAVGKHTLNVYRAIDNKVLGRMIVFSRSGGDIPTFAHPSSFSCPEPNNRPDLLRMIFSNDQNKRHL